MASCPAARSVIIRTSPFLVAASLIRASALNSQHGTRGSLVFEPVMYLDFFLTEYTNRR